MDKLKRFKPFIGGLHKATDDGDMRDELDSKGHMTLGMPENTVKKAYGMLKDKTHKLHTSAVTGDWNKARGHIDRMKKKGWDLMHHEENFDNHAILFSRPK